MKLSKRIKHSELSAAVDLLERGRGAMQRQEWEKGETQESWDRAVGNYFAILEAQVDYESEMAEDTADAASASSDIALLAARDASNVIKGRRSGLLKAANHTRAKVHDWRPNDDPYTFADQLAGELTLMAEEPPNA